ncbi:hypothetical protein TSUD_412460, partial [Trifolium subterraneum]
MYSRNVPHEVRHRLNTVSSFVETSSLGKYLGVPALDKAPKRGDFNYLIEKIKSRLSGWKAKQLSLAGRITLSKSVIQAIPVYPMMSTSIPKSCLHEIEKIQRTFIWGHSEEGRKAHMIGWNQVTLPKEMGGLGIRKLAPMNDAFLMKFGWSLRMGERSLWAQVLRGKYGRNIIEHGEVMICATDSSLWKTIGRLWPFMTGIQCWDIGNGTQISFWEDIWIDKKLRLREVVETIPDDKRNWRLCDAVTEDDNGPDTPLWPGERMGNFSVATAYQYLTGVHLREYEKKWFKIWRLETTERIRVFMWQVLHDRILTNWRTAKWNLTDPYCSYCEHMEETTLHVLRDCPLAVEVWQHLLEEEHRGRFFIGQLHQWIDLNLSTSIGIRRDLDWDAVWVTTCFWLWKWRNKRVHEPNHTSQWKPWSFILNLVNEYKYTKQARETEKPCQKELKDIKWIYPAKGWVCLNTDGAAKSDTGIAGCGGILRNDNGIWICGFSKFLGNTSAYMAEVWGLYEGLSMARNLGIERLEVQVDSEVLVMATKKDGTGCTMSWNIMRRIRALLDLNWEVRIKHIFCEGNRCADVLANMGCNQDAVWMPYQESPAELLQVLSDDFR